MRPVLVFFLLTFVASWTCFIAGGMLLESASDAASTVAMMAQAVILLGVFMPAFVALLVTARVDGRPGVHALLGQLRVPSVAFRWVLFALFYMVAIKLLAALAIRVGSGAWPPFGTTPWFVMLGALVISTPVQAGEEIGWRGYALPRLALRFGWGAASVALGIVWALWHLPLFFVAAGDTAGQSFPMYLLQVTALSVAFAWLYLRTGGSLLLVMLLHAAVNNTKDIVPSAVVGASDSFTLVASPTGWTTVLLLWIAAGWFLLRMRRRPAARSLAEGRG